VLHLSLYYIVCLSLTLTTCISILSLSNRQRSHLCRYIKGTFRIALQSLLHKLYRREVPKKLEFMGHPFRRSYNSIFFLEQSTWSYTCLAGKHGAVTTSKRVFRGGCRPFVGAVCPAAPTQIMYL
jgi:hypothetical protein